MFLFLLIDLISVLSTSFRRPKAISLSILGKGVGAYIAFKSNNGSFFNPDVCEAKCLMVILSSG